MTNPWIADFIAEWEAAKAGGAGEAGKVGEEIEAASPPQTPPAGEMISPAPLNRGRNAGLFASCHREAVASLGYQVRPDGVILRQKNGPDNKKTWKAFSKLGARHAVLNDLLFGDSPKGIVENKI